MEISYFSPRSGGSRKEWQRSAGPSLHPSVTGAEAMMSELGAASLGLCS